jgi:hypothetical protein
MTTRTPLTTTNTLYAKVGRRYRPVSAQVALDCLPMGVHVLHIYPGGQSIEFRVQPDFDAIDAALLLFADDLRHAVDAAFSLQPASRHLTVREQAAWKVFEGAMRPGRAAAMVPCVSDAIARATAAWKARVVEAKTQKRSK